MEIKISDLKLELLQGDIVRQDDIEAAEISLRSIKNIAKSLDNLKLICFVLYNESDLQVYQSTAKDIYIL